MRRISVLFFMSAVLMAVPAGSAAQGLPSDPEADSPSGVVYELPVERARKDAAPQGGTQRANGEGDTSIRSENNFGTSSDVPGATPISSAGSRGAGSGRAEDNGRQRDDKSKDDAGVAGDADAGGGGGGGTVSDVARSTTASTQGPSDGIVFPLVAVLLGVGVAIGMVAARRSPRRRSG